MAAPTWSSGVPSRLIVVANIYVLLAHLTPIRPIKGRSRTFLLPKTSGRAFGKAGPWRMDKRLATGVCCFLASYRQEVSIVPSHTLKQAGCDGEHLLLWSCTTAPWSKRHDRGSSA
jgi:hypothetical protein